MTSFNVNCHVIISLKCFDDVIIILVNAGFLIIKSHESTARNKISKTLLWKSLHKVTFVTAFKVS